MSGDQLFENQWGISSVGRALAWHARGAELQNPYRSYILFIF